jgi:hypothetical protein
MHMPELGDFSFASAALEFARDVHADRSEMARRVDDAERAPVTTDAGAWAEAPSELDFPGVDTPREEPPLLPKDQMDPAPLDVAPQARGESRRGSLPSPERNTTAPEPETARLGAADVSLSFEEAFEGVATDSQGMSDTATPPLRELARGEEADLAFDTAEQDRLFEGDRLFGP